MVTPENHTADNQPTATSTDEMLSNFEDFYYGNDEAIQTVTELSKERLNTCFGDGESRAQLRLFCDEISTADLPLQLPLMHYICGEVTARIINDFSEVEEVTDKLDGFVELLKKKYRIDDESSRVPKDTSLEVGRTALKQATRHTSDTEAELDAIRNRVSDPVRNYLNAIGKTELLTKEEEVELAKDIEVGLYARHKLSTDSSIDDETGKNELRELVRIGERAKEQFVKANLRLVVSIARKYRPQGLDFLEVIQEGNLGLMHAVEMFDYMKGFKFSTYATWWIRQSITRAIADKGSEIRVPVHRREQINNVLKTKGLLFAELGRQPTDEELASELDESIEFVKQVASDLKVSGPVSFNMPIGEEAEFGDIIPDQTNKQSEQNVDRAVDGQNMATHLFKALDEREAEVIRLRFGLGGEEPHTLDRIAQKFGITRERIRQLEARALEKLRVQAENSGVGPAILDL